MTNKPTLREVLEQCWDRDTSATPSRWRRDRPSIGQCAITALLIQDCWGGELLRVMNHGESHYFNRLSDGTEVDLTRDQFDDWSPTQPEVRSRDYVLSFEQTVRRYTILLERIDVVLS